MPQLSKLAPIKKPSVSNGASKSIALTFGTLATVVLIAFAASAWTEPTGNPPAGNVSTPLNISATSQTKSGALSVSTLYDTNNTSYFIDPSAAVSGTFAGNVGIGTTSPGAKLEVNGQIKIQGGSPGAGKILTSDASGLASWQTAASGDGYKVGYRHDELSTNSTSYVKKAQWTAPATGTVQITWWQRGNCDVAYEYGRVYVNGVAVGTEKNGRDQRFNDTLSVNAGDLIQIYLKNSYYAGQCYTYVKEIRFEMTSTVTTY